MADTRLMNLLDGMKTTWLYNDVYERGIIVQTAINTKNDCFVMAILTDKGKICVKYSSNVMFDKKDLDKLRKKAPEIAEKLARWDMLDL